MAARTEPVKLKEHSSEEGGYGKAMYISAHQLEFAPFAAESRGQARGWTPTMTLWPLSTPSPRAWVGRRISKLHPTAPSMNE